MTDIKKKIANLKQRIEARKGINHFEADSGEKQVLLLERLGIYEEVEQEFSSLITTIESQKEEIEKLKGILERLPSKITQLDSWADTEELTFPLSDPTEENQLEWFEEFNRRLDDHVQSCFDGELYELEPQEGENK